MRRALSAVLLTAAFLLPGRFLPDNSSIELKGKRRNTLNAPQVDYQVIHRYLDGFKQRKVLRDAR